MGEFVDVPDRRAFPGEKWGRYGDRDVIPMWVADTDFAAPSVVTRALEERIAHGVFGYAHPWPSLVETIVRALERDHGFLIDPTWLVFLPGVVTGLNVACRLEALTKRGVFSATPIYPPFLTAPSFSGKSLVQMPLSREGDRYVWDFDRLTALTREDVGVFLLCNPHNPVGRAFSREELTRIGELAIAHDMILCSDEIHCGLVLDPRTPHVPIAALGPEIAKRTITLMAPSKTWNIPSLYSAFAIIPDASLRRAFSHVMRGIVPSVNVLGLVATEAAYRDGEPYRRALIDVLRANAAEVKRTIDALPGLSTTHVEATYLAWIDCRVWMRERGIADPAAHFESHGVGFSDGKDFGAPGFVRLNFGCARATLDEGLARMRAAVTSP